MTKIKQLSAFLFGAGLFLIPLCLLLLYWDILANNQLGVLWDAFLLLINLWAMRINFHTAFD